MKKSDLLWLPSFFLLWLASLWPNLPKYFYAWALDPADGDVIATASRLQNLLPLYGDWVNAQIYSNYGPIYSFYLAIIDAFPGDLFVIARISNALFLGAALFLVFNFLRHQGFKYFQLLFLAVLLVLGGSHLWSLSVDIRPDSLALFFCVLSLGFCFKKRPKATALFVVAAIFTKQTYVIFGLFGLLRFAFVSRQAVIKYSVWALIFCLQIIIPMEFLSGGHFLRALFVYPSQAFSGAEALQFSHFKMLLNETYKIPALTAGLLLMSVGIMAKKKYLPPLVLFSLCLLSLDFLFLLRVGQNTGGGLSYFWVHWICLSLLISYGLGGVLDEKFPRLSRPVFLHLLLAAISVAWVGQNNQDFVYWKKMRGWADGVMRKAQRQLKENPQFTKSSVAARPIWMSDRQGSLLYKLGIQSDLEACTAVYAFTGQGAFDPSNLQEKFSEKQYWFLLLPYPDGTRLPVNEQIQKNYYLIERLWVVDRWEPRELGLWMLKSKYSAR